MIDDDIQIQRDRKDVTRIQDEIIGRQPPPPDQIELPLQGPENEVDVLGSNWADQEIITSDTQLSDEEIGLLPLPLTQQQGQGRPPPPNPLWKRLAPYRIPVVTNPKYDLPQTTTTTTDQVPFVDIPTNITNTNDIIIPPEPPIEDDSDHFLVQRVVYPGSERVREVNLFPIFISGMMFMTAIFGLPLFLL